APTVYFVGTTNVIWTVTDAHGNSATFTQGVTIVDGELPSITCPGNLTVNPDAGQCFASSVDLGTPVATDNCGVGTVTNDAPAQFPVGTTIVIWTVNDAGGNAVTCQQTVTVTDTEPPSATCPATFTVNTALGQCFATGVVLGSPTASDNC